MLPTHSSQSDDLHNCFRRIGNKTGYAILKFSPEFSLIINEDIILSFGPLNRLHLSKQIQYLYNALHLLLLPGFLIYLLFLHHLNYHRKWINASEDRRSLGHLRMPRRRQDPGGRSLSSMQISAQAEEAPAPGSFTLQRMRENDLIAGYQSSV